MKRGRVLIALVLISMFLVPFVSAGMFDWFKDLFNIGEDKNLGGELFTLSGKDNNLIAYYNFEGNVNDASGNNHDGTNNGVTFVNGIMGQAGSFDGNSYIDLGDDSDFELQDHTISMWVKKNTNNNYLAMIGLQEQASTAGGLSGTILRFNNDNSLRYLFSDSNSWERITSTVKFTNPDWTHIAITKDGGNIKLWVNGVKVKQKSGVSLIDYSTTSSKRTTIGGYWDYSGVIQNKFNGMIDELKIWNVALDASEIMEECEREEECIPDCSGKECGDDGCEGSCGTCGTGEGCFEGDCISDCLSHEGSSNTQDISCCGDLSLKSDLWNANDWQIYVCCYLSECANDGMCVEDGSTYPNWNKKCENGNWESISSIVCTDSDSGKNYNVKGTSSLVDSDNDYCSTDFLYEYSCNDNIMKGDSIYVEINNVEYEIEYNGADKITDSNPKITFEVDGSNYQVSLSSGGTATLNLAGEPLFFKNTTSANLDDFDIEILLDKEYLVKEKYAGCSEGCQDGACISNSNTCNQDSDCPAPVKGEVYCQNQEVCADINESYCNGGTCNTYTNTDCSHCPEGCSNGKCNGDFEIEKIELVNNFYNEENSNSILSVKTSRGATCTYSTDNINFIQFYETGYVYNHFQELSLPEDLSNLFFVIKCVAFDGTETSQTFTQNRNFYEGETCNDLSNFILKQPKSFIFNKIFWKLNYNRTSLWDNYFEGEEYNLTNSYVSYQLNNFFNDYNGQISFSLESYEVESEELRVRLRERLNNMLSWQLCSPRNYGDNEDEIYYVCKDLYDIQTEDDYENAQIIWMNENKLFSLDFWGKQYDSNYYNYNPDQLEQIKQELYDIQREVWELHEQGETMIKILSEVQDNPERHVSVYANIPWILNDFVQEVLFEQCPSDTIGENETICFPSWQCKTEPVICPSHGYQTKTCIDRRGCFEKITTTESCSPGICSGCYVPRWFQHEGLKQNTLDNICMPYGTRFNVENGWTMEEIDAGAQDNKLTIKKANKENEINLIVFENNTAIFNWTYFNKTYYLEEGMSIDFDFSFEESYYPHSLKMDVLEISYNSEEPEESYIWIVLTYKAYSKVPNYINMYCNYDGQIMTQKTIDKQGNWANCQNNYECESNLCSSGECVEITTMISEAKGWKNFLAKIACKLGHLFNIENYQQCVVDRIGGDNQPSSSSGGGPPSM